MSSFPSDNRWTTPIIVILVVGTIASFILSATLASLLYINASKSQVDIHFFETRNPQTVTPHTVHLGERISVTSEKCNLVSTPILTKNYTNYVRETPSNKIVVGIGGEATFPPGCTTKVFVHDLSKFPEIGVGVWHIEGRNISTFNNRTETSVWYSQSFEVVP